MSVPKRRSYDAEFKKNAVLLCDESDRTVSGVAESLGIPQNMLYRWRRELNIRGEIAFSGRGNEALSSEQREIKELRKRLQDSEIEREILKKALGIFSRASK